MPDLAAMIRQAEAEGRVRRYPPGRARGLDRGEGGCKWHPELCGKGGLVHRAPFLDELDKDFS